MKILFRNSWKSIKRLSSSKLPHPLMIKAILFDFIGTTVKEADPDVFTRCFMKAFADNAIPITPAAFAKERGKDKKTMIGNILADLQLPLSNLEAIYDSFKNNISENVGLFCENDGLAEILYWLHEKKIKTGIGSGLERDVFDRICQHLQWDHSRFDYTGLGPETGRCRPYPDMIFDFMKKMNITDPGEILKVGDTVADMEEGKNAGVKTAVILSGTQAKQILLDANPDFVLTSLADLRSII